MRKLPLLVVIVLLASLWPAAAQAHELSTSSARAEARYYAETIVEHGVASRIRIHSCRRHSAHVVSCAYRTFGTPGARCVGRVRAAYLDHKSPDTISRVVGERCR